MNYKTNRIFLAIACGVGIGLAVGRELATWHWLAQWFAPVIGGVFAYLAVDNRRLISALPRAWKTAPGWDWPTKKEREYIRWWMYAWWSIGLTVGLSLIMLSVILKLAVFRSYLPYLVMGVCAGYFMFLGALSELGRGIDYVLPKTERTNQGLRELKRIVRAAFPLAILFYHLPRGLWWMGRYGIPQAGLFVGRFAWHWFKLVHSDLRLLCLVDAALFTSLGLVVGGPILAWMVGGGVWGVVNYRIISVWLLKLAPR